MKAITTMKQFSHPEMPGVTIYAWDDIRSGRPQQVVVDVSPGTTIPPHKHSVDAQMIIVGGEAEVLFDEEELRQYAIDLDRKIVTRGDLVQFNAGMTHGFRASSKGLTFLSINGGIVDEDPTKWDMVDMHMTHQIQ